MDYNDQSYSHERPRAHNPLPDWYYAGHGPHAAFAETETIVPGNVEHGPVRLIEREPIQRQPLYLVDDRGMGQHYHEAPPYYTECEEVFPVPVKLRDSDKDTHHRKTNIESLYPGRKEKSPKLRFVEVEEPTKMERAAKKAMKYFLRDYERKQTMEKEVRRGTGMYLLKNSDGSILVKKKRR
jgi:hypothetical protein